MWKNQGQVYCERFPEEDEAVMVKVSLSWHLSV